MTFDIIIIGSGLAGYTLVKELRRLNKQTSILMISTDDGCYYSKPMLSTGFAKHKTATDLAMKSAVQMAQSLDITVYASTEVLSIDKKAKTVTVESSHDTLIYANLVLATGAEPVQIPLPPVLTGRCFPINDLVDYGRFREHLGGLKNITIIGSGLVGTEYANDMSDAGINITVVALDDGPLQLLLPPPLSQAVKSQLENNGINFHFNNSIEDACLNEHEQIQMTLSGGATITSDLVLSAIGLKPRIKLAEQAGLTVNQGIVVDQILKTDDASIYALGDCAEIMGKVLMYVAPIAVSAKALAKTLSGEATPVHMPAAPVIVKTPSCPVVSSPPATGSKGKWVIEGDAPDLKACFIGEDDALLGFGLTGKKVVERMKLAKQLPAIL
jgi:rubredoxin-NAD+ reductase